MELTAEKIKDLLNILLLEAKRQRSNIPYSKFDGFPQAIVFIGPDLEPAAMPITWSGEGEKYAKMKAVSKTAQAMFCQAVCLISDTRWVEEAKAVKILGIPPREEVGADQFCANYRRVVQERFKGYLGNAPKELFNEAIIIAMKGPRIDGPHTLAAPYEEGPNDSIRWTTAPELTKTMHFNLLPDWWV